MKWYVAILVVECRVGREPAELWDEQIVVLRAKDRNQAHTQVKELGKSKNSSYKSIDGETVRWKFLGIGDLQELRFNTIRSGTEVFSRLTRSEKPRIPQRRDLQVFWFERNKEKTVEEILTARK